MSAAAQTSAARALRDLVRQTIVAGVARRAALLHLDRLPAGLARPHHQRLARNALLSLAERDHAQSFELPQGRLAIVWRSRTQDEVSAPMAALAHLLADQPNGQEIGAGQLLSLFDLPHQAPWLLDTLTEGAATPDRAQGLDAPLLARLEDSLAQADIAQFLRWRPVMEIDGPEPRLAWEERIVAWHDLAATLCPERNPQDGSLLARRLARTVERRVLTALTGPQDRGANHALALDISVASLLAPVFLTFDAGLPASLRGRVILRMIAADILADPGAFCFARNFAQGKGYRLLLRDDGPSMLDPDAAGLDYVELRLSPGQTTRAVPHVGRAKLVLDGLDDAPCLAWARAQGVTLGKGAAVMAG